MPAKQGSKKDFICTQEWKKEELDEVLRIAKDLKANPKAYRNSIPGKSVCMLFYNPSTRTRNSTEVAAHQLGMQAVYNDSEDAWIGYESESIQDTAKVLARYYDALGIRIFPNAVMWKYKEANKSVREFAKWSEIPIINFEDDLYHPLQELADILTIQEKKKTPKGKKIVISWAYHPKGLPMSVVNSILLITTRFGMDVTLAHPVNYELDDEILQMAKSNAKQTGGSLDVSHDIKEAYKDADVVYAKSWCSLQQYGNDKEEKQLRMPYRDEWRVKEPYIQYTKPDSVFMHCLPIRRNVEADDAVVDGKHSVIYDEAENRLFTVKALLYYLLAESGKNERK